VAIAGDGVRVLGTQDDAALRELYAGALALVHPALLVGFAFPPVEALAYGTPAIVADLPVHDETIGAGALRVAPGDEAALAAALLEIEHDGALRERLVAAGRAEIATLSWDRAARETLAVIAETAS
jgi:glycosyltransferase involved in cell wall biosynthesis